MWRRKDELVHPNGMNVDMKIEGMIYISIKQKDMNHP